MNNSYYIKSDNGLFIPYNFYKIFNSSNTELVIGHECELDSNIVQKVYPDLPRKRELAILFYYF